ncbi:MAG: DUF448 domain-containing protein [Sphingomonadales bacterium]|nr:DUF448 domain-containing protein [Sphingomonadales bacterium]
MENERTCVVTRETKSTSDLIRFVVSPDGVLVPDVWRKLPGRGVWVNAEKELLLDKKTTDTLKVRASAQFKKKVELLSVGEELVGLIETQLKQQALNRLGLMRASGQAVMGFEKVASAIRGGKIRVLVEALDGKEDGTSKLQGLCRGGEAKTFVIDVFDRDELSKALGGGNVVHVALLDKKQSERFLIDALRLSRFQGKAIRCLGGLV